MTRHRKLSTTLMFLTATALAGVVVTSAPALAAPGGIPGPNPDAPGQIEKDKAPLVIKDQGTRTFGGNVTGDPATGQLSCDHGYVDWQTPNNPRQYPLLMVHAS